MINKLLTSDGDKDQANGERTTKLNMYLVISKLACKQRTQLFASKEKPKLALRDLKLGMT